jgi:hypothetical protein
MKLNRNQKFLLKAGMYFVIIYALTIQMMIIGLNYFLS